MTVIYLGPDKVILNYLKEIHKEVRAYIRVGDWYKVLDDRTYFIVSFGFGQIVPPDVINAMDGRIINVHIGLLPFQRGIHPCFWSWIEGPCHGVTIHQMDAGIDTGPILVAQAVDFNPVIHTLRTSYNKLIRLARELFMTHWLAIYQGEITPKPQIIRGHYHERSETEKMLYHFPQRWDTPVRELLEKVGGE